MNEPNLEERAGFVFSVLNMKSFWISNTEVQHRHPGLGREGVGWGFFFVRLELFPAWLGYLVDENGIIMARRSR